MGLVFYFVLLEDKDFLKDRPTDNSTTSADLYDFFDDKVEEKVMKTEENADILKFYRDIVRFIRNNEMLTLENFQNVPAPDSEFRMNTIKRNFEKLCDNFVKLPEGAVVVEADETGQCKRLIIIINDKYK